MELCIRPGRAEDLPTLIELQNLAIQELCCKDYDSRQLTAIIKEQIRARQNTDEDLFVAETNGKIVGFSAISKQQPEVAGVYVHPNWARQGIGTQLLAALEQKALDKRFQTLTVLSSLTAIAFYDRQGYCKEHQSGFWIDGTIWIPCLLMKKHLTPTPAHARSQSKTWLWWLVLLGVVGLTMCHAENRDRALRQVPIQPTRHE